MKHFKFVPVWLLMGFLMAGLTWADQDESKRTTYRVDPNHSQVAFKVRHLGISTVNGSFDQYDASVSIEEGDPKTLQVEIVIDAKSINTGTERRDNHLRSEDFFHVEQYPEIKFVSKKVMDVAGQDFKLLGDLTMHGVTKEIILEVEMRGPVKFGENERIGFSASGKLNRKDWGLTWNRALEAGGLVVGEEVKLVIEAEAVKIEG